MVSQEEKDKAKKQINIIIGLFALIVIVVYSIRYFTSSTENDSNSIVGIYKNGYLNQIEIKEDGTYIISECNPSMSIEDLQTADPDAEAPLDCVEKSRGKWKLDGSEIQLPTYYPYTFGVKSGVLFYNDLQYGKGTIEFRKQ